MSDRCFIIAMSIPIDATADSVVKRTAGYAGTTAHKIPLAIFTMIQTIDSSTGFLRTLTV